MCSTTVAYHYFLHGSPDRDRLAAEGLSPRPPSEEQMTVHHEVYAELFAPALQRSFTRPGVFFTPIDFRALPDSPLARRPRVAIGVDRLDQAASVLTWELDGVRVRTWVTAAALECAASIWTRALVQEWFGRNRQRLFWYLPQIGCFTGRPIAVGEPEWPAAVQ